MLERLSYSDDWLNSLDKINAVIDKVNEMADMMNAPIWYPSNDDPTLDKTLIRPMDRVHEMRKFDTGATRDTNTDKLDYKGFTSEVADRAFAEYMHKHRRQADGSLRGSDNWKLGIPLSAYEESMYRHFKEFFQALERGEDKVELAQDIVQAIRFNLQGWVHEVMKMKENPELFKQRTGQTSKP